MLGRLAARHVMRPDAPLQARSIRTHTKQPKTLNYASIKQYSYLTAVKTTKNSNYLRFIQKQPIRMYCEQVNQVGANEVIEQMDTAEELEQMDPPGEEEAMEDPEGIEGPEADGSMFIDEDEEVDPTGEQNVISHEECGILDIKCSTANIYMTLTDGQGKVIHTVSGGMAKIGVNKKGRRTKKNKFNSDAMVVCARMLAERALEHEVNFVVVRLRLAANPSVKSLLKEFVQSGCKILHFEERIPIAHNGCRPRKMTRQ